MKPTPGDVHVDRALTNISLAYVQAQENYIADKVFPVVPVARQSDRFFLYDKGDLLRDEAAERAPGTESVGSGVGIDNTPSYYAPVYAYHEDVSDQLAANADQPINPFRDSAENVMQKLLTKKEVLWASKFFAQSVWDTDREGVSSSPTGTQFLQWDAANADPVTDIENTKETIRGLTGYDANTLVLGAEVFSIIKNNSTILDRIRYTQKGIITTELLAPIFGVDRVLVAKAVQNTAAEGATATIADIFGKAALLVYAAPNPSIRRPSGGYTFSWTGMTGGSKGIRTKRFRMEHLESDRVEGEMAFVQKIVGADLGAFMYTAIS